MKNFGRRMKLTAHFGINDIKKKQTKEEIFKPSSNSKWLTKDTHHTIKNFIDVTSKDFVSEKSKRKQILKSNLTLDEWKVLSELAARNDIIMSNGERGGAVVIQHVKDYIKEA